MHNACFGGASAGKLKANYIWHDSAKNGFGSRNFSSLLGRDTNLNFSEAISSMLQIDMVGTAVDSVRWAGTSDPQKLGIWVK